MGRDCLEKIKLDWHSLHQIQPTHNTIQSLYAIFSTHGLLEVIVSGNGAPLVSAEFKKFLSKNRVCHTSTPYHPKSNRQVERSFQTLKQALKKSTDSCLRTQISYFLFKYRVTTHITRISSSELLMNCCLRSHLDLSHPRFSTQVKENVSKRRSP